MMQVDAGLTLTLGFSEEAIGDGWDCLNRVLAGIAFDVTDAGGYTIPMIVTSADLLHGEKLRLKGMDPTTERAVVMYDVVKVVYA